MGPTARRLAVAAATLLLGAGGTSMADDLSGYVEVIASESDLEQETFGFEPSVTESSSILRRLSFRYQRRAFPLVRFWVGGTFEDQDTTTTFDAVETDSDIWRVRPYLGIGRRTRGLSLELSWNRNATRSGTTALRAPINTRDRFSGVVNWAPEPGSVLRASVSRVDDRDDAGRRDLVSHLADLSVTQQIGEHVRWSYRGSLNASDDRVARTETTTSGHRGVLSYEHQGWDRRFSFRSEYSLAYRRTEIELRGPGAVDVPLFPLEGLSVRDDTPLIGALDPNGALVDDDLDAGAGVDLGLPPPGGDDRPWGIGVDFGRTLTVDALFVWVDRDLRTEIAQAFTWDVYTSPDNLEWTPRGSVSPAPFDEFLRRFTIRFAPVATRYVKLVVRPLTPDVPFASEFPDILVTEIDAAVSTVLPSSRSEASDTVHTLNVDTRVRLLANHELYFEGSYFGVDRTDSRARYALSSGFFYTLPLGPGATFTTRAAWEELREEVGTDSALVYSATLATSPVPRLRYTLSLSGREEQVSDEIGGDQTSLFFYGFAQLYDGVDVQVGVGRSYNEDLEGGIVESTTINGGFRIEPRRDLTAGILYNETSAERRDLDPNFPEVSIRSTEVNATWTPVPTLYFFGAHRLEWRAGEERDTVRTGIVSWAPFPGGDLRFGFNYNEVRRSRLDQTQRSVGPNARWYLGPRTYLNLSYVEVRDESELQRVDNNFFNATLRFSF